jgi:phosphate-selective porin OprO and OprP
MKSIKMRGVVAAVAGALMFGFGANAMADSTDDIINALIAKGVLTEEEGALLQKGRDGEKAGNAKKSKVSEKTGSFTMESGDGKNTMSLTGRMQFDLRTVDNNAGGTTEANLTDRDTASMGDNFEVRRARIGVKGKVFEHYDYEVIGNAVGSNTNILDVAYINLSKYKEVQPRLGLFKQPFNLEDYGTSSNNIDFMERSYVNQINPGKKPGVMIHGVLPKGFTYAASVYQQNAFGELDAHTTGKGFAGRLTSNVAELAGFNTKESVMHLGVAGFDSEYGVSATPSSSGYTSAGTYSAVITTNASVVSFRSAGRGLANAYRAQIGGSLVSGGNASSTTSSNVNQSAYGLEMALAQGPFKVQGEYSNLDFDSSTAGTSNTIKGKVETYYVEAMYMLTGENYADWYKNGAWSGIKPKNNFDIETGKGKGAWEVGFRFDRFEVTDVAKAGSSRTQGTVNSGTDFGGGAETYTAGLKWQLTPNMRMLANYSHTKFDTPFTAVDTSLTKISKEDLLMLRTQISF